MSAVLGPAMAKTCESKYILYSPVAITICKEDSRRTPSQAQRLNNDNLMHAKLFSLHAVVANKLQGAAVISSESKVFIVNAPYGKPLLF